MKLSNHKYAQADYYAVKLGNETRYTLFSYDTLIITVWYNEKSGMFRVDPTSYTHYSRTTAKHYTWFLRELSVILGVDCNWFKDHNKLFIAHVNNGIWDYIN